MLWVERVVRGLAVQAVRKKTGFKAMNQQTENRVQDVEGYEDDLGNEDKGSEDRDDKVEGRKPGANLLECPHILAQNVAYFWLQINGIVEGR